MVAPVVTPLSVWVVGQLQGRPVFTLPKGCVLPQRQLDCLDAVQVAALTHKFAVLAAMLAQDFEDSVVHQTHQLRMAYALAWLSTISLTPPRVSAESRGSFRERSITLSSSTRKSASTGLALAWKASIAFTRGDQDREQRTLLIFCPRLDPRRITGRAASDRDPVG